MLNIAANFRNIQSLGGNFLETFPEILTKFSAATIAFTSSIYK